MRTAQDGGGSFISGEFVAGRAKQTVLDTVSKHYADIATVLPGLPDPKMRALRQENMRRAALARPR